MKRPIQENTTKRHATDPKPRQRRRRTQFTDANLRRMEEVFRKDKFPGIMVRESLADELGVKEDRLQVWFQNRRARWRKHEIKNKPSQMDNNNDVTSAPPRETRPEEATSLPIQGPSTVTGLNFAPFVLNAAMYQAPLFAASLFPPLPLASGAPSGDRSTEETSSGQQSRSISPATSSFSIESLTRESSPTSTRTAEDDPSSRKRKTPMLSASPISFHVLESSPERMDSEIPPRSARVSNASSRNLAESSFIALSSPSFPLQQKIEAAHLLQYRAADPRPQALFRPYLPADNWSRDELAAAAGLLSAGVRTY